MPSFWKTIGSYFGKPDASEVPPLTPVVALITGDRDRALLRNLGAREQLDVQFADTCAEAWSAANRLHSPVVLCEREVPGLEWQDAVRMLASATPHPCVILASPAVDEHMWKEIVERGGYDVVAKPLRDAEAARTIRLAVAYWQSAAHLRAAAVRK
jgi:DNA-binding NtrC family response regulator